MLPVEIILKRGMHVGDDDDNNSGSEKQYNKV